MRDNKKGKTKQKNFRLFFVFFWLKDPGSGISDTNNQDLGKIFRIRNTGFEVRF
jgi:hypothetical protein